MCMGFLGQHDEGQATGRDCAEVDGTMPWNDGLFVGSMVRALYKSQHIDATLGLEFEGVSLSQWDEGEVPEGYRCQIATLRPINGQA